ncbi:hypothetical protein BA898_00570 [Spiribacter roseus]|nr:hypothetical protein BA898_00570 [Spiribacter roseus]
MLVLGGCSEFDYPADRAVRESAIPTGRAAPTGTADAYTVREGDTLYQIAFGAGLDFRDIAQWNDIEPPYMIYPGQSLQLRPPQGRQSQTAATPAPVQRPDPSTWQWPLEGEIVRDYNPGSPGKRGIGIAADPGSPVLAAAAGEVVYSGNGLPGYGNLVIIQHNARYLTAYGYNRALLVDEGATVAQGETIARVGASDARPGELHFELRQRGEPVDPGDYLP